MDRLIKFVILGLFISGCATTPKTLEPTTAPEKQAPIVKGQMLPEMPPVTKQPVVAKGVAIPQQQTIITYSQVTNLIEEFLDIKPIESVSGKPMFLGTSETNLVTLEIIGDKDSVSQTSMRLIYPKDIETINVDLNNAMMLRFLKNVAPEFEEWPSRVKEIINKFSSIEAGNREKENIALDKKIIQVLYERNKNINSIILTVKLR